MNFLKSLLNLFAHTKAENISALTSVASCCGRLVEYIFFMDVHQMYFIMRKNASLVMYSVVGSIIIISCTIVLTD